MNWHAGGDEEGLRSDVCRVKVERGAGKALASRIGLALRLCLYIDYYFDIAVPSFVLLFFRTFNNLGILKSPSFSHGL